MTMTHTVYAAAMIAALVARPAQAAGLAELFSSPAAANLTIDTIRDYFAPAIDVENFSRDRCFPVLKASPTPTVKLVASFIGTTLHRPCSTPQKIVIAKFQFFSATPDQDTQALSRQLASLNSRPCAQTDAPGHLNIAWSDKSRILALTEGTDQGPGYTLTLFSRTALTPPQDEADTQAYKLWNSAAPPDCQSVTPDPP